MSDGIWENEAQRLILQPSGTARTTAFRSGCEKRACTRLREDGNAAAIPGRHADRLLRIDMRAWAARSPSRIRRRLWSCVCSALREVQEKGKPIAQNGNRVGTAGSACLQHKISRSAANPRTPEPNLLSDLISYQTHATLVVSYYQLLAHARSV